MGQSYVSLLAMDPAYVTVVHTCSGCGICMPTVFDNRTIWCVTLGQDIRYYLCSRCKEGVTYGTRSILGVDIVREKKPIWASGGLEPPAK